MEKVDLQLTRCNQHHDLAYGERETFAYRQWYYTINIHYYVLITFSSCLLNLPKSLHTALIIVYYYYRCYTQAEQRCHMHRAEDLCYIPRVP